MRTGDYYTDGYHRVRFYHERGILPVLPTREQMRAGIYSYSAHRVVQFKMKRMVRQLRSRVAIKPMARQGAGLQVEATGDTFEPYRGYEELGPLGRALATPMVRGIVLSVLCPEYSVGGRGLCVGTHLIVNHLLYLPHVDIGALWDLQLLHPDPGGLDLLEERLEVAATQRGRAGKLYHTVAAAGGDVELWYRTLAALIPRIRQFDYPDATGEPMFIEFVERCSHLGPREMKFFRNHDVLQPYPEIEWPRPSRLNLPQAPRAVVVGARAS